MALSPAFRTTLMFSLWSSDSMQELLRESAKKSAVPFAGTDWLRFNNCRQWVRNTKQIGQTTQATHE